MTVFFPRISENGRLFGADRDVQKNCETGYNRDIIQPGYSRRFPAKKKQIGGENRRREASVLFLRAERTAAGSEERTDECT
jgi:hypothetical protein